PIKKIIFPDGVVLIAWRLAWQLPSRQGEIGGWRLRALAITVIVTIAAMTALPFGSAKAACLPDDLACCVHGGSGMVFERGGSVPRARSGNTYVDRATRAVTSPRQETYRRSTRERETWPETRWNSLSNWQELDESGRDLRES